MRITLASILLCLSSCLLAQGELSLKHINPFIGTGGHGHTHPSASTPFGMVQLGPDTRREGWDGCSGYHYTDQTVWGFSHTHLSGTGVGDYGDFLFRPVVDARDMDMSRPIGFDKDSEIGGPGYYRVTLDNGVICEFTASDRVGIHRYTFPMGVTPTLMLDLNYRDRVLSSDVTAYGDKQRFGMTRISQGWASEQHCYGHMVFQEGQWKHGPHNNAIMFQRMEGEGHVIEIAFALSGTGQKGAQVNYEHFISDGNQDAKPNELFESTYLSTQANWQAELDRAQVQGGTEKQKTIYATALYHAFLVPNMWSDADGRYRGLDQIIYTDTEHDHYTIFSLWDTYRTAHPLYLLTQPERSEDFIVTMLDHFKQSGRLPVWELAGNETNCMIGYHSVSAIADAVAKGYAVDTTLAFRAMRATANTPTRGLPIYNKKGYLTIQDESESVSKTLEYDYDNACIAWSMMRLRGPSKVTEEFWRRSQGWKSLLDPETGLMRPRDNGQFIQRYNPREVNNHFTEANSWQYSFAPVHDLANWKAMLNSYGHDLESQLDALFTAPSETTGRDQADITGLIGQYAHGNEPSHHIAYLYNATENAWKGQQRVQQILEEMYDDQPFGYQGNEDCGQMSAWYVMSSWGIYPLVPGEAQYAVSAPIWDRVMVTPTGFDVHKGGQGDYVASVNDKVKQFISHEELLEHGATIVCSSDKESMPEASQYRNISHGMESVRMHPAPTIEVARRFEDSTLVKINYEGETELFWIDASTEITLPIEANEHRNSAVSTKRPTQWDAAIIDGIPNPQYHPGADALLDGVHGDVDWRKGEWIGIQGQNATFQLSPPSPFHTNQLNVEVSLLKDIRAWIALPVSIEIEVLNVRGKVIDRVILPIEAALSQTEAEVYLYQANHDFGKKKKIGGIRITLVNAGNLEAWHPGAGGESFFFIDEVSITPHE